jgi:hypothetical protein
MKKLIKFFKKFKLFDILIITLFLILTVAFFVFFFRQSKYLTIKLKVSEKNILYSWSTPPFWFANLFKPGMKGKDGLGRTNVEILDVYSYESAPANKAVYLTLRLRATYNTRSQEYIYEGTPLAVGDGLRINFGEIIAEGLVVEADNLKNPYEETFLEIDTQYFNFNVNNLNSVFSETTGIEPFVADSVKIGDQVLDSSGKVMAEVIGKEVLPAKKNTFDDKGNVYLKFDPRKKDLFLRLKIRVKKINNEFYFFDDVRIKVDQILPLHFSAVSIYPVITGVRQAQ